jgi:hypothetical protein
MPHATDSGEALFMEDLEAAARRYRRAAKG